MRRKANLSILLTTFRSFIVSISVLIHLICMRYSNLLVEEAYYWNYAQHLDLSYLDHPPMIALLIKFSTLILGTHELSVRMPSLLCWFLVALFSYKLTRLIHTSAAMYAVMLLAILPFFSYNLWLSPLIYLFLFVGLHPFIAFIVLSF